MDLYEHISRHLEDGGCGVLATVVRRADSAPGDAGAKMFVGEDGAIYGAVGAVFLEHGVRSRALEIVRSGRARVFAIDGHSNRAPSTVPFGHEPRRPVGSRVVPIRLAPRLSGGELASVLMKETNIRSGSEWKILVEPVTPKHLTVYQEMDRLTKKHGRAVAITTFGRSIFTKSVLAEDMTVTGDPVRRPIVDWCRNLFDVKRPVMIGGVLAEPLREIASPCLFDSGRVA